MQRARVISLILVGALWAAFLVFLQVRQTNDATLALITPGKDGPAAALIRQDFPESANALPEGLGHDGQLFYAIARKPAPLAAIVPYLDRPCYRLQRPLYPWLAWLLHPGGGGRGLIWAMVAVNFAALIGGSIATAGLLARLGGRPELAAAFPILGGSLATLRLSTADNVATALVIAAIFCTLARRSRSALALAVLAVLAKETMLGVLVGVLLWARSREALRLVAIPTLVALAWGLYLRHAVGCSSQANRDVVDLATCRVPLCGLVDAARVWANGQQLVAAIWVVPTLLLALVAVRTRGISHPCVFPILLQLASISVLSIHVIGLDFNGPRATLPLAVLTLVALATPRAVERLETPSDRA